MELKGTKTEKNLQAAFAGESQARNKYTYYASQAKKEGFEQIAAIFTETANNEKEHAKMWFKLLNGGIGKTVDNLKDAAAGENYEWTDMYAMLAEIFPNSIRSTVMSIAVAAQWIANFLVSWTFPMLDKNQYLTDTFNHGMAYWIYGVMGILAALFIWKFVPETKGKTLEEMEGYWKR